MRDKGWVLLLMAIIDLSLLFGLFQLGRYYEREDVIQTIKMQQKGTQLIKIPNLRLTLIPFVRGGEGFISWWDKTVEVNK